jgi:hypothetical protein
VQGIKAEILATQASLAVSVFKQSQEPQAQALGIDQGIEWKAICNSPVSAATVFTGQRNYVLPMRLFSRSSTWHTST